jgi:hypothetical protein
MDVKRGLRRAPVVNWSLYAMRKDWNQAKEQVALWWAECSKEAYNTGLDQLARGLKNWADSRKGARKGCQMGGWARLRRMSPRVSSSAASPMVAPGSCHAVVDVDLGIKTRAVFSDGRPPQWKPQALRRRQAEARPAVAGRLPQARPGPAHQPAGIQPLAQSQHGR